MTTLKFNPFYNLGEQIEYGALANKCGFGQDKRSSFACILAKFQQQEEEIKRLQAKLAAKEDMPLIDHSGEYTCAACTQALNGEAIQLNALEGDTQLYYICAACYEIHKN